MTRKQQVKKAKMRARQSLAKGRPPLAGKPTPSLSRKATNDLITSHHQLRKQLDAAEVEGNEVEVGALKQRINDLGGLKSYQLASMQGQASERGGDSSLVLMEWLEDLILTLESVDRKLRVLEVGALSTKNACSKSGLFNIERIDLHSQTEGIIQEDFMVRPMPASDNELFDVISLSLVINFVPNIVDRGEMLKRTCRFLDRSRKLPGSLQGAFPALFLVMPAACITNSRYLNEERLTLMMASLGYVSIKRKQTAKLVYYLWQLRDKPIADEQDFPKQQISQEGGRNNFCIVLKR